jgi:hypothetical protein
MNWGQDGQAQLGCWYPRALTDDGPVLCRRPTTDGDYGLCLEHERTVIKWRIRNARKFAQASR